MPSVSHDLVELGAPLRLDIKYARQDNFLGFAVYRLEKAFLQKPVYESLLRAHRALARKGYGILVFDGYRPWSVTKIFWENADDNQRQFLANPDKGSVHNRGCAIDCTLYDLKTGEEVRMPSEFDEMNEAAWSAYAGGTEEERQRRDLLIAAMADEGFSVLKNEWWHFNHPSAANYEILDLTFESLISE